MPAKKLTEKEIRFIYFYMSGNGNGVEAARLAGYKGNRHTLEQIAYTKLRKRDIIDEITRLRNEAGITPEHAAMRHKELMDAESVVVRYTEKKVKGRTVTTESIHKEPDKRIRATALDMYYKLEAKYKQKVEHSGKIEHEHHLEKDEIGGIFENIRKASRLGILNLN